MFKPLPAATAKFLHRSLLRNAKDEVTILTDERDTSFIGATEDVITDEEVITAIRSIPCHY